MTLGGTRGTLILRGTALEQPGTGRFRLGARPARLGTGRWPGGRAGSLAALKCT